jgi:hypothetical protein
MRVSPAPQTDDAKPDVPGAGSGGKAKEDTPTEDKFTVAQLRSKSRRLFGVSKHAVAGALSCEGATEFTVKDAARKIKEFLDREVPPSEAAQAQGRVEA